MASEPNSDTNVTPVDVEHSGAQASRRRMLRRSLGVAAPVVVTLVSNPVSACTCIPASSFVSFQAQTHHSRTPTSATPCNGATPATWVSTKNWPSPYDRTTSFTQYFGYRGPFAQGATFLDVLNDAGTSQKVTLGKLVVAALLNEKKTKVSSSVLPYPQILEVWKQIINGGSYKPSSSSVTLNITQAIQWLSDMMA